MMKENDIIAIGLPAHTSHVLQPLDVTVFAAFKSHLQAEVHQASRMKKVLDAFDIAEIIRRACDRSHTVDSIQS